MARPKIHDAGLRLHLLELAAATVHAHGVESLSLRQLAADAGTSTSAVYTLFGGREQLLEAVVLEGFASFTAAQNAVAGGFDGDLAPAGRTAAELAALGREYRNWALAHPVLFSLMFSGALNAYLVSEQTLACAADGLSPLLAAVRRGQESGALRAEPAEVVATQLWGMVHGLTTLELAGMGPDDMDWAGVYESSLEAAVRGWMP
ncbi:TetR/AcrR family transcriptional regulator [Arthrobacter sp. 35W]|uniref:TetR/AcrR family transcriptional regulator n=1 Tax=Arthrobacter sp. 35W TaxID=1132441 RepID=UPI0004256164|nr:TetR/AcrR family transcriptional regulator [Arthrobacter sp. 35W]